MTNAYIKKFGYCELYEFANHKENIIGRFVGFSNDIPGKICLYNKFLYFNKPIGITSINFVTLSDDSNEWHKKYECNEFGDIYLEKKDIAIGKAKYDEINELLYMTTQKSEKFYPIVSNNYDQNKEYIQRLSRPEWASITLLGKAIVTDNGLCTPGKMCKPYDGDNKEMYGTAIPSNTNINSFYVIERFSKSTILILVK